MAPANNYCLVYTKAMNKVEQYSNWKLTKLMIAAYENKDASCGSIDVNFADHIGPDADDEPTKLDHGKN